MKKFIKNFVWDTNSRLMLLAGLQLCGQRIEMKEKPLPLNAMVELQCYHGSILSRNIRWAPENSVFSLGIIFVMTIDNRGTDNGSIRI